MLDHETVLLLIGFQNDYFSKDGILHGVFEDPAAVEKVIDNTCQLIETIKETNLRVVETPIKFTEDYTELDNPIGILKMIKDSGAFKQNSYGSATIDKIAKLPVKIESLAGKRGLNCFSNTSIHELLQQYNIKNVLIAGAVTSLCLDTAGREALDLGYNVTMLSDCILARTKFEQQYYLEEIMPLYSTVQSSQQVIANLTR
ncbi:MAG: cysteine hydrolase [Oceanospirillaceae bacterium]|nr:cysteine hydrolase [Oceanospirillaceae bacterium]